MHRTSNRRKHHKPNPNLNTNLPQNQVSTPRTSILKLWILRLISNNLTLEKSQFSKGTWSNAQQQTFLRTRCLFYKWILHRLRMPPSPQRITKKSQSQASLLSLVSFKERRVKQKTKCKKHKQLTLDLVSALVDHCRITQWRRIIWADTQTWLILNQVWRSSSHLINVTIGRLLVTLWARRALSKKRRRRSRYS